MAFKIRGNIATWHDSDMRIEVDMTRRDMRIAWHSFANAVTLARAEVAMDERANWSAVPINAQGLECMASIAQGYVRGGG